MARGSLRTTSVPRPGSLRTSGTIAGSVERFNLQGSAEATGLIVRGNAVRHLAATYSWTDAQTSQLSPFWSFAISPARPCA